MNIFNGIRIVRRNDTIFIPLPRQSWVSCGRCDCSHCKGTEGFWDTLALGTMVYDRYTYTVHAPELQPK